MMMGDRRLRTLFRLAEQVEGAAYMRVREAIRKRQQELELEDDDVWTGPLPPPAFEDLAERDDPPVTGVA